MIGPGDIRRLALACSEASEADHHGIASFRVAGKIFCTIHVEPPRMMVKLAPEDQHNLSAAYAGVIEPVPGYWGRKGSTFVWYERAGQDLVAMLIQLAWAHVAPKRLQKSTGSDEGAQRRTGRLS